MTNKTICRYTVSWLV